MSGPLACRRPRVVARRSTVLSRRAGRPAPRCPARGRPTLRPGPARPPRHRPAPVEPSGGRQPRRLVEVGRGTRELGGIQRRVGAVGREQLGVRALLDDAAVLHDEDEVGVADRREAVRDDEARAVGPQRRHGVLDEQLGARVDRARRLVEDEQRRVGEERAGDRDELLLAGRDVATPRRRAPCRSRRAASARSGRRRSRARPRATSSSVAPGRPYAMLSRIVPPKSHVSCSTMPMRERRSWRVRSRMSTPSSVMRPPSSS